MHTTIRYKLIVSNYFDELTAQIDLEAEQELGAISSDEPRVDEVNKRRETFLAELKQAEATNLAQLNEELNVNELASLDETSLMQRLFRVFPFFVELSRMRRLVIIDSYLSPEQLSIYKQMLSLPKDETDLFDTGLERYVCSNDDFSTFFDYIPSDLSVATFEFSTVFSSNHQLVIKSSKSDFFEIKCIDLSRMQIKSVKPEATFLFENIKHIALNVRYTADDFEKDPVCLLLDLFESCQRGASKIDGVGLELDLSLNAVNQIDESCDTTTNYNSETLRPKKMLNIDKFLDIWRNYNIKWFSLQKDADKSPCQLCLNASSFKSVPLLKSFGSFSYDLASFQSDVFMPLKHVSFVTLFRAGLTELDLNSFYSLSNLKFLNLTRNKIKILPADMLNGLDKLETLFIISNVIESIEPNAFRKLAGLCALDLSNNQIKILSEDAFEGLVNLKWLTLMKNPISYNIEVSSSVFTKHLSAIVKI